MNKPKPIYRQGDVALVRISKIPATATKQPRNGPLVLAYGEATGHHHSITDEWVDLYTDQTAGVTYLEVREAMTALIHQEHAPVELPQGKYMRLPQREYSPSAVRPVGD